MFGEQSLAINIKQRTVPCARHQATMPGTWHLIYTPVSNAQPSSQVESLNGI